MAAHEVAARLREDQRLPGVRIVGVGTASERYADLFDAWVAKPVDPAALQRALAVADAVPDAVPH
jgi:CheY-like chemotaxis protein